MDVTADKILNVGGTSQIAYMIGQQCSIDEFVAMLQRNIFLHKRPSGFYCSLLPGINASQLSVRSSRDCPGITLLL